MIHGQKQNIKTDRAYFLTLTIVGWIDVFTRKNHRDAILDSLRYCQKEKGLIVFAYVIMSNHIHLIANTNEPFPLKDTIRDFKKFTSRKIISLIQTEPESRREWMLSFFKNEGAKHAKNIDYKFWQDGNHAIELYNEKFVWDKINYIHNNPVEVSFVKYPHEWVYSSATNYQEKESILFIETVSQPLIAIK
ncbi:MAG: REP-associated tyrosine transposase [Bacteroidota bacterium]